MKNSQVYFIQKCQTQYYDYNANEKVKDLLSKYTFPFLFSEQQKSRIYRQKWQENMETFNGFK